MPNKKDYPWPAHHGFVNRPPEHEWPWNRHCAPDCDDQLPVISRVGRGLKGTGYRVKPVKNDDDEFILVGYYVDPNTGEEIPDGWASENLSAGKFQMAYNLRPWTDPATFTITFWNQRPGQDGEGHGNWHWTTPAIPYLWDRGDGEGDPQTNVANTGVASIFIKKVGEEWDSPMPTIHTEAETPGNQEKLLYPGDADRSYFNAPDHGAPWTVNLAYGMGVDEDGNPLADIEAPSADDLEKILGVPKDALDKMVRPYDPSDPENSGNPSSAEDPDFYDPWPGTYTNKYGPNKGDTVDTPTIKNYIDAAAADAANKALDALQELLDKIVPGPVSDPSDPAYPGHKVQYDENAPFISFVEPLDDAVNKIAAGDINLYSGDTESLAGGHAIRTHGGDISRNNDIKAV
jgi:hypothetical protein